MPPASRGFVLLYGVVLALASYTILKAQLSTSKAILQRSDPTAKRSFSEAVLQQSGLTSY